MHAADTLHTGSRRKDACMREMEGGMIATALTKAKHIMAIADGVLEVVMMITPLGEKRRVRTSKDLMSPGLASDLDFPWNDQAPLLHQQKEGKDKGRN